TLLNIPELNNPIFEMVSLPAVENEEDAIQTLDWEGFFWNSNQFSFAFLTPDSIREIIKYSDNIALSGAYINYINWGLETRSMAEADSNGNKVLFTLKLEGDMEKLYQARQDGEEMVDGYSTNDLILGIPSVQVLLPCPDRWEYSNGAAQKAYSIAMNQNPISNRLAASLPIPSILNRDELSLVDFQIAWAKFSTQMYQRLHWKNGGSIDNITSYNYKK
ncbi:MAG: hypothetical protein AAFP82_08755, partial [Bacteroidota bacterium]